MTKTNPTTRQMTWPLPRPSPRPRPRISEVQLYGQVILPLQDCLKLHSAILTFCSADKRIQLILNMLQVDSIFCNTLQKCVGRQNIWPNVESWVISPKFQNVELRRCYDSQINLAALARLCSIFVVRTKQWKVRLKIKEHFQLNVKISCNLYCGAVVGVRVGEV